MQEGVNTLQIGGMVKLARKSSSAQLFLKGRRCYTGLPVYSGTVWSTVPGMEYFILFRPFVMPALT